ncbi:MAG: pilus assembly protein PilZ [Gammaproteobacteria bacterium]|nr:MAG: pilus assembly protein PilZ [Gammaproteobacteria bacterium]
MSETDNPESKPKKKRFVLPIDATDRNKLHSIYMPFIAGGGLFFATERPFDLGDEVNILLNLIDEPEKILLEGRVVWLTPKHSEGGNAAGIGVKLEGENASQVRSKIDNILAGTLTSGPYTQTM